VTLDSVEGNSPEFIRFAARLGGGAEKRLNLNIDIAEVVPQAAQEEDLPTSGIDCM